MRENQNNVAKTQMRVNNERVYMNINFTEVEQTMIGIT